MAYKDCKQHYAKMYETRLGEAPCPWCRIAALEADAAEDKARISELENMVYLGEHHFPDHTYKARCEELVIDLRACQAKLSRYEALEKAARNWRSNEFNGRWGLIDALAVIEGEGKC